MQSEVKGLGGRVGRQGVLRISRQRACSLQRPSGVTFLFFASHNALLYGNQCCWAIPVDLVPMHVYPIFTVSTELIPIRWEFWTFAMMPHVISKLKQVFPLPVEFKNVVSGWVMGFEGLLRYTWDKRKHHSHSLLLLVKHANSIGTFKVKRRAHGCSDRNEQRLSSVQSSCALLHTSVSTLYVVSHNYS